MQRKEEEIENHEEDLKALLKTQKASYSLEMAFMRIWNETSYHIVNVGIRNIKKLLYRKGYKI